MKNLKIDFKKRFAKQVLAKKDLSLIKGGGKSKYEKEMEEEAKKERKRCKKAWKDAEKLAKKEGRRLKRINGNGNGIW